MGTIVFTLVLNGGIVLAVWLHGRWSIRRLETELRGRG